MDDLAYFQSLRENNTADDNTLYILGKLLKERKKYSEALSVFGELMMKQNEDLNDLVLREITEINALKSVDTAPVSDDTSDLPGSPETPALKVMRGNSSNVYKLRNPYGADVTFKDVGGLEGLKKTIEMKIIKPFQSPEIFEKFLQKSGGGLLLYGPPGCGKTFIAKATAGECNAHFRSVRITDILGQYLGQSEQNMRDVFASARAHKPCILFFDEIDTLGFSRLKSGNEYMRGIVDQLLTEIEGIDSNTDKLLIIGATNMPWDVDVALRRPGRFDRSVFVPPPDIEAREVIFRLKTEGRPIERLDYRQLAEASPFFSGADIEHIVELAAERVLDEILSTGDEHLLITQRILMETLASEKPSTMSWLKTISDYVKYANQAGAYNDVEAYLSEHKLK